MTEQILTLLAEWGLPILGVVVFFSCLALPVPSSIAMLTCGSLVGAGDMSLLLTWGLAFGAAVCGDQVGYYLGRRFGTTLIHRLDRSPKRHALIDRARHALDASGGKTVFLSRWLFSPLGPYVNFLCGSAHFPWHRFSLWSASGEAVWVTLYIALGFAFGDNITAIAEITSDLSGIFAALAAIAGTIWYARVLMKRHADHHNA